MKIIFQILLVFVSMSSAGASGIDMSKVNSLANEHDCTPLWQIASIGNDASPWYVNISELSGTDGDFVFLCKKNTESYVFTVVVAANEQSTIWKGCPLSMDTGNMAPHPFGLKVRTIKDKEYFFLNLNRWEYENGEPGPDEMPTEPMIDTSEQIAGDLFYCYEGRWLKLFVH